MTEPETAAVPEAEEGTVSAPAEAPVDEDAPSALERLAKKLAATVVLVTLVAALFGVAYFHASTGVDAGKKASQQAKAAATQAQAAAARANQIATCINSILGTRGGPSLAATNEQTKWVSALADVLAAPPSKVDAVYREFKAETQRYKAVLITNQGTQVAHPLGHC